MTNKEKALALIGTFVSGDIAKAWKHLLTRIHGRIRMASSNMVKMIVTVEITTSMR